MKRSGLWGLLLFSLAFAAHAATYTFGTCGATGATGPLQAACNTAYGGSVTVTVTGGIQSWTVPATGTYTITATGAQGASGDTGFVGGKGAQVSGQFNLTAGQVLQLVVGQQGVGQGSEHQRRRRRRQLRRQLGRPAARGGWRRRHADLGEPERLRRLDHAVCRDR